MSDSRQTLRDQRKKLSPDFVFSASARIAQKIIALPAFSKSQHIACYVAHENEVDLTFVIERIQQLKKISYLPIVTRDVAQPLVFSPIQSETIFSKNRHEIIEPIPATLPIFAEQLDLLLIPVVAFDAHCNRLGRGAGYYDRALSFVHDTQNKKRPVLIGVAYEFQKINAIETKSHDVMMDSIVTEECVYWNE